MGSNGVGGAGDVTHVGLVVFIERRGDTNDNGVHRCDSRVVGGSGKALCLGGLNLFGCNAVDIRTAFGKCVDLASVDIETGDLKFLLAVQQSERKSDIAHADDADSGLALLYLALELVN